MKARTKYEMQVVASNERLTAVNPKAFEWGVRNLFKHPAFRVPSGLTTCGDCGHKFTHKGKGKFVVFPIVDADLKSRTPSNVFIRKAPTLPFLIPLTAYRLSECFYWPQFSRKASRWDIMRLRCAVYGSMPKGKPHWHRKHGLSVIIEIVSVGVHPLSWEICPMFTI